MCEIYTAAQLEDIKRSLEQAGEALGLSNSRCTVETVISSTVIVKSAESFLVSVASIRNEIDIKEQISKLASEKDILQKAKRILFANYLDELSRSYQRRWELYTDENLPTPDMDLASLFAKGKFNRSDLEDYFTYGNIRFKIHTIERRIENLMQSAVNKPQNKRIRYNEARKRFINDVINSWTEIGCDKITGRPTFEEIKNRPKTSVDNNPLMSFLECVCIPAFQHKIAKDRNFGIDRNSFKNDIKDYLDRKSNET